MEMVEVSLGKCVVHVPPKLFPKRFAGWVKHIFPDFEFTWLGDEMRQNLPKEMDFVHEAQNSERATRDFEGIRTSLYIRERTSCRNQDKMVTVFP